MNLLTKAELRARLEQGKALCDILQLTDGQECEIFKADVFRIDNKVIYIPDVVLNGLVRFVHDIRSSDEYADDVIQNVFTGQDFVDECNGDVRLAEQLFWYCDWQHPSSALPEVYEDE